LKVWAVLDGNKIESAVAFAQVLDCCMALHNFILEFNRDPQYQIPRRNRTIPGEHVFSPIEEKNLKIPAPPRQRVIDRAPHVERFKTSLLSMRNELVVAVGEGDGGAVFFPNVISRGKHLFDGAYVLQLQLQEGLVDDWFVRFKVGASYSYESHIGYLHLTRGKIVEASCCDCYAGYS
jgi:hypothetical protein